MELSGLEPLTPCLQIDVVALLIEAELAHRPSVTVRCVPSLAGVNGTLMARRSRSELSQGHVQLLSSYSCHLSG